MRTIAATTWAEYRQYIEKDPALTRRFQPIHGRRAGVSSGVAEMLRGVLAPMEKHHKVRISDAAVVAAAQLSARYIPARQLPDKAVSLLDTACARVAISQSATPAAIADKEAEIAALDQEKAALIADRDLGDRDETRITEIDDAGLTAASEKLATLEADWEKERAIVEEIRSLREILAEKAGKT